MFLTYANWEGHKLEGSGKKILAVSHYAMGIINNIL